MATELEGKPLKFTALFDSKDAEMKMDEFLKKVQSINTKGAGNNASKTVTQASGQYKSILDGVSQSFTQFVTSNERFYSEIAKAELGLRKISIEQNFLNSEMRRGLITDEEYINKSSKLTQIREKLSQQLKDNKAQLQQYNSVATAKPAFTSQDTAKEISSAFGSGVTATPNMSATDAFAKATQQSINNLNKELVELENKLKAGSITNDQYAKSTGEINTKLKEVKLNQEQFGNSLGNSPSPTEELNKQKTVLDAVSNEYKEMISDASSAFQSISPQAQGLTNNLITLREENRKLSSAQKELDEAFKRGDITQKQYLEASRNLGVQQGTVKQRIAETRKELSQIDTAERQAIGSIAEKTAKLTQLKQRYDQLSESQRKNINVGGKIKKEYQDLSKEVDKLNTSLSGTKSDGIGSVFSSIQGIAGAIGIAFGANQLISFGVELFNIAKKAEGVELAFAKIGDPTALNTLREATKGTVSDLNLMTQAVRADKFRIPMDLLAKGLEFARIRANETGQSVDYLNESFVNGLGRQSKLILDNLGISARELTEEVERTGNFMKAVSNIIDKDLSKGGQVIDMLSDKTDRLATRWENVKKKISDALRAWFNVGAGGATPEGIEKQVIALNKAYEGFESRSSDQQKKVINQIQSELDFEKKRSQLLAKSIEKESIKIYGKIDNAFVASMSQQKGLDKSLEKVNAMQASLEKFKGINQDLDKQNRQKQGIFSLEELESKLSDSQNQLKISIDKNEQAKLRKEIAVYQKQIQDINGQGKTSKGKTEAQKLADQVKKEKETYDKLVSDFKDIGSKYTIEIVSPEQTEINKVIEEYDKKIEEAKKYNSTTKGNKIDIGNLEIEKGLSVNNVISRQEKQSEQKKNEDLLKIQKENYDKMLELSKHSESEILAIRKKYSDAYELLEANKTKYTLEEFQKRKEALKKGQTEEISAVLLPELKQGQDWVNVFDKSAKLSRTRVQKSVDNLRVNLKKMLDNGTITIDQYKEAIEGIKNTEVQIQFSERGFGRIKQILKELKDSEKGSIEYDQARQKLGGEINYWGQGLVEAGEGILNIADSLGVGSEKFREDMALSLDLANNAVNLASSIASGDVVGMVTNGIKTISSTINLFTKDRGLERKIKEYQKQLEQLGETYIKLQYQISNSVGESIYSDTTSAIKNLKEQQVALKNMSEVESKKKKADQSKIESYKQEIQNISLEIKNLEKSITETLVQTSFKDFSNSLAEALLNAFEAGESGVDALDKTFDQFIKKALVNSLKLKMIEPLINNMVNELSSYMQANDNSLIGFDFEKYKKQMDAIGEQFNGALDEVYGKLGLTKDGQSNSTLKSEEGITRMSESTGTEIVGMYRAGYDIWKRQLIALDVINSNSANHLRIATDKLTALNAIQVNTANTVVELRSAVTELQEIKRALR